MDPSHGQKLAIDTIQESRIKHRWKAIDKENEIIEEAKKKGEKPECEVFENGDSLKQLLARGRYLLYKSRENWTQSQKERAKILFGKYPDLQQAYHLT